MGLDVVFSPSWINTVAPLGSTTIWRHHLHGDDASEIELICLARIRRALRLLLETQFGMSRDDLTTQTARLFGFSVTGSRIGQAI